MQSCFREEDLLFRFGGEEFVVILQIPDRTTSQVALERLRSTIEETDFPGGVGRVTISIGAIKMSSKIFHTTLMDYADQALYYAKNNGRNQVVFFSLLVAEGIAKYEDDHELGEIEMF